MENKVEGDGIGWVYSRDWSWQDILLIICIRWIGTQMLEEQQKY